MINKSIYLWRVNVVVIVFVLICLCIINVVNVQAGLIASSKVDFCIQDGTNQASQDKSILNCNKKLIVTMNINSNQDSTESLNFIVNDVIDTDGKNKTLLVPIKVTFKKTPMYLNYRLGYLQTVAGDVIESVIYKTDYIITDGCKDLPSDSTCGSAKLPSGELIRDSQGFCCSCAMSDYIGEDQNSRANLKCTIFGSRSTSAHCMSFSVLKYDVFEFLETMVDYTITAGVSYYDYVSQLYKTDSIAISPSKPIANSHGVLLRVIGDLQSSILYEDFDGKKIVFARASTDPISALPIVNSTMILEDSFFDLSGLTCNKIGVSYGAFQNQPNRCAAAFNSCLNNQLSDYYSEDLERVKKGLKPKYLIFGLGQVGVVEIEKYRHLSVQYAQPHTTLLSIVVTADDLQFVVNISPGKIIRADVKTFEAMSIDGTLTVDIKNIGTIHADYIIAVVNCTIGIAAVPYQQSTIQPNSVASFKFDIRTISEIPMEAFCYVDLSNELGDLLDSVKVLFNVTETVIDYGAQEGSANSIDSDDINVTHELTCDDVCPNIINLLCFTSNIGKCSTRFALMLLVIISIVVIIVLLYKFPILRNLIKKLLCCGCCNKNKSKKYNKHNNSRDEIQMQDYNNSSYNNNNNTNFDNQIQEYIGSQRIVYFRTTLSNLLDLGPSFMCGDMPASTVVSLRGYIGYDNDHTSRYCFKIVPAYQTFHLFNSSPNLNNNNTTSIRRTPLRLNQNSINNLKLKTLEKTLYLQHSNKVCLLLNQPIPKQQPL
ncbi:hypothetical protein CYY_002024 [Polysphondylium violaceum]|uniref:Generative cell specific-1/HAP2 domain-containing protein n=1 Tax=Polysphondylium violaceum TaxID=133409 RepID=A0A8J4Q0R3_9MYCE|nr:hypothetical protein CYY_002024 [Polysphondylium violaceum]